MIDVISGGRLISGFVRGIGAEYHTFGVNPTFSHDRFHEAHDLIVRAWTEPGPFSFQGQHYNVQYVNLWPRPLPEAASADLDPVAGQQGNHRLGLASRPALYLPADLQPGEGGRALPQDVPRHLRRATATKRRTASSAGQSRSTSRDTDEQRAQEAKPHFEAFRNVFVKMPLEMLLPPGYTSRESLKNVMKAKAQMFGDVTHRAGDRARPLRLRQRRHGAQSLRGPLERNALRQPAGDVPVRHAARPTSRARTWSSSRAT